MFIDPTGMSSEDPNGLGRFFQRVGNLFKGDGWKTNEEVRLEKNKITLDEVTIIDPNTEGEVCSACPKKRKQKYGEPLWGSSDEQLLETPDAETTGESQELFPMRGAPGKASGNFFQKLGRGINLIRKWVSWGTNDTPPGTPPVVPKPEPPSQERVDSVFVMDKFIMDSEGRYKDTIPQGGDTLRFEVDKRK